MCNVHLWWMEKWPVSNCSGETKKLRSIKKKATRRNVIYPKNWVAIGGSTLKIIRWCYYICQKFLESSAIWLKLLVSFSCNFPLSIRPPDTLISRLLAGRTLRINFCHLSAPICALCYGSLSRLKGPRAPQRPWLVPLAVIDQSCFVLW